MLYWPRHTWFSNIVDVIVTRTRKARQVDQVTFVVSKAAKGCYVTDNRGAVLDSLIGARFHPGVCSKECVHKSYTHWPILIGVASPLSNCSIPWSLGMTPTHSTLFPLLAVLVSRFPDQHIVMLYALHLRTVGLIFIWGHYNNWPMSGRWLCDSLTHSPAHRFILWYKIWLTIRILDRINLLGISKLLHTSTHNYSYISWGYACPNSILWHVT